MSSADAYPVKGDLALDENANLLHMDHPFPHITVQSFPHWFLSYCVSVAEK